MIPREHPLRTEGISRATPMRECKCPPNPPPISTAAAESKKFHGILHVPLLFLLSYVHLILPLASIVAGRETIRHSRRCGISALRSSQAQARLEKGTCIGAAALSIILPLIGITRRGGLRQRGRGRGGIQGPAPSFGVQR